MLYERWRKISMERAGELALFDLGAGRRWSFAELAREAEQFPGSDSGLAYARGADAGFVLRTVAAWRDGKVLCPLEKGQSEPALDSWPAGCVHLKITSATSGAPKMIVFTANQLLADVTNIVSTMGLRAEWPNLAVISLAHSYGFSNLVLPLLLCGVPLILAPAPLPELILRASGLVERITLPAVPALWRVWCESNAIPRNIALGISAGAPLPLSLEEDALSKHDLKIHNFYGSSECGGIAYDRTNTLRTDAACAGSAMDNVRLSVSPGGTLVVQSKAVAQSYWPEASALGHGRFATSDLAEVRDGLVFLRGRGSDVINIAGRKVSPETIEQAVRLHGAVRECVVFGVPDATDRRFERIVACVALQRKANIAELNSFLADRLHAWQIPREWWFVDTLAANERGKVSRAEWRRAYERRRTELG